jgi:hypothetical protein
MGCNLMSTISDINAAIVLLNVARDDAESTAGPEALILLLAIDLILIVDLGTDSRIVDKQLPNADESQYCLWAQC